MAKRKNFLEREGAAHLQMDPAHTHLHLGGDFQKLQPQTPDRGPLQLRSAQALCAHVKRQGPGWTPVVSGGDTPLLGLSLSASLQPQNGRILAAFG